MTGPRVVSVPGGGMARPWLLLTTVIGTVTAQSLLGCTEPTPVANAYTTTTAPYSSGSVIRYLCVSPFSMAGSPARTCTNGTWDGSAPTCSNVFLPPNINIVTSAPTEPSGFPNWAVGLIAFFIVVIFILLMCSLCVCLYFWRRWVLPEEETEEPEKPVPQKFPPLSCSLPSPASQSRSSTLSPRLSSIPETPTPVENGVPRLSLGEVGLGSNHPSPRMSVPDVTTPRFVVATVNGTPRIVRNY